MENEKRIFKVVYMQVIVDLLRCLLSIIIAYTEYNYKLCCLFMYVLLLFRWD